MTALVRRWGDQVGPRARLARVIALGLVVASLPSTAAAAGPAGTRVPSNAIEVAPHTALPYPPGLNTYSWVTDGVDTIGADAALWVDDAGTAHIAYLRQNPNPSGHALQVELCTIPAGAHNCGGRTAFDIVHAPDHLQFINDAAGNGYLLISVNDGVNGGSDCALRRTGCGSGHTQLITIPASGSPTQSTLSQVWESNLLLEPDASGFDQVGTVATGFDSMGAPTGDAAVFAFDPLTQGALGGEQQLGTSVYTPNDVTKLPDGQTAVIGQAIAKSPAVSYLQPQPVQPVAMRVQPAAGGPFGPWRRLGVSNPVALTYSSPGSTYLLNAAGFSTSGDPRSSTLQLYEFAGTRLGHPLTIGRWTSPTGFIPDSTDSWAQMTPLFADGAGSVHLAWPAKGGDDGCPKTGGPLDPGICLLYRQVLPGLVAGPKIVLVEDTRGYTFASQAAGWLQAIAANRNSDGWLLFRLRTSSEPLDWSLYAVQLPGSAAVTGAAGIGGARAHVSVHCAGSSGCAISASVTHSAHGRVMNLGTSRLKLMPGQTRPIVVRLNATGRRLLRTRHQTLKITVTQHVGQSSPILYQKTLGT